MRKAKILPPQLPKGPQKTYTDKELKLIAHTLNILTRDSQWTPGATLNTFHFTRFFNKKHYIDYHEKKRKYTVYKHYKGWHQNDERLR